MISEIDTYGPDHVRAPRFLDIKQVSKRVSKSRSSIYAAIRLGEFPSPKKTGNRSVRWLESDITDWIQSRVDASFMRTGGDQ
jgi:prophage regulatory protein